MQFTSMQGFLAVKEKFTEALANSMELIAAKPNEPAREQASHTSHII